MQLQKHLIASSLEGQRALPHLEAQTLAVPFRCPGWRWLGVLPASGATAAIQAGGTQAPGEAEGYGFKPLSVSCNPFSGPEEQQPLQLPGHGGLQGMCFPKASPRLQGEQPKILGLFGRCGDSPYKAGE